MRDLVVAGLTVRLILAGIPLALAAIATLIYAGATLWEKLKKKNR